MTSAGRLDRVGLGLCVVSAAAFGSLAIFGKQAYEGGLGVVGVLAMRFGLAAPLLVGLVLVAGGPAPPLADRAAAARPRRVGYASRRRCSSSPTPSRRAWPPGSCTCTRRGHRWGVALVRSRRQGDAAGLRSALALMLVIGLPCDG